MSASQNTLRVAVVGAKGRMGRFACEWITGQDSMEVVHAIGSDQDLAGVLAQGQAQVVLDLTRAGLGAQHAKVILEAGKHAVIGTSGVDPSEDAELDRLARERGVGGLIVPNFSLGVCLQQDFALRAARLLRRVEIVEEHNLRKVDRPSATALDTADRICADRGRDGGEIPIHSLRTEGLISNQTVVCTGPGEVLRLVHETYGLEAFGPGISLALRHVVGTVGVRRGLQHA
ncbi:MAG: 4-hydroxy-tetrahydrodipicolinate reductase, partial [Planctomycetes bacterium]|nr:4-hydroxy-tetrahydrodipicolinate reductase [Planctomycetota bacterium]